MNKTYTFHKQSLSKINLNNIIKIYRKLTCFFATAPSMGSVYSKLSILAILYVFPSCDSSLPTMAGSPLMASRAAIIALQGSLSQFS